jgi:hypothetical protein
MPSAPRQTVKPRRDVSLDGILDAIGRCRNGHLTALLEAFDAQTEGCPLLRGV